VRLGRERDDEIEIQPSQSSSSSKVMGRACRCRCRARPWRRRRRVELALAHAGGARRSSPARTAGRKSPAAIGERTELRPQVNSTACGGAPCAVEDARDALEPGHGSPLPVQHADQGEQAARVSKSTRTLRLNRSIRMPSPSSCSARGPCRLLRYGGRRGADRRVVAVADSGNSPSRCAAAAKARTDA